MKSTIPCTLGIDPGLTGALAALSPAGDLISLLDMPTAAAQGFVARRVDAVAIASWLDTLPPVRAAALELVASRPGQGVASMLSLGRSLGVIEGLLAGRGIRLTLVRPQTWKAHAGLLGTDKDGARLAAIARWGDQHLKRKKDHGRADALMIAAWAITHT